MTRELVTRTDGVTVDLPLASAESYDENAKLIKLAGLTDLYIQRISYGANNMSEYIGLAKPGTAASAIGWQIKKLSYDGNNVVSILFASGNNKFDKIWDSRVSYSYS